MRGVGMAVLLAIGLTACTPVPMASVPVTKLVVGYVALNAAQMPAWIAKDKGIFESNALDVELRYLPSSASPTAAALTGDIQVLVAAEQPIQADLNGADLVYIAAPTSAIFYSMYARPEIVNTAGLKGKKLGITAAGAATETAAHMALRSLHLDPATDMTMTSLGSAQNILAALQNGAVDAGILSSPTSLQAQALGMHELVNVARLKDPFPSSWAAASRAYIATHHDAIRAYVKSIAQAIAFEVKQPAEAQTVLAKYVQIDNPAIVEAAYEEVVPYLNRNPAPDPAAVRTALQELSVSVPMAATADPSSFIDSEFTDELDRSGFLKSLYL